ncbi:unnamed protein product [Lactuca saligna]|uniref:Uncharacterized protein n=1 Tax=Lactuca saligna TaxID=75948 RepID=A0AA35VQC2_LACSI|nr:unnamed protein product [Lactuca saligna]
MVSSVGVTRTPEYVNGLREEYDFHPKDMVVILLRKPTTNFIAKLLPSSVDEICILDDDVDQTEGMRREKEQPVVSKVLVMSAQDQPHGVAYQKYPPASEMYDYDELIACLQGKNQCSQNVFPPSAILLRIPIFHINM